MSKIHLLNIIKITKKDCKRKLMKDIKVFLKKKKTIWSRKIQKSLR